MNLNLPLRKSKSRIFGVVILACALLTGCEDPPPTKATKISSNNLSDFTDNLKLFHEKLPSEIHTQFIHALYFLVTNDINSEHYSKLTHNDVTNLDFEATLRLQLDGKSVEDIIILARSRFGNYKSEINKKLQIAKKEHTTLQNQLDENNAHEKMLSTFAVSDVSLTQRKVAYRTINEIHFKIKNQSGEAISLLKFDTLLFTGNGKNLISEESHDFYFEGIFLDGATRKVSVFHTENPLDNDIEVNPALKLTPKIRVNNAFDKKNNLLVPLHSDTPIKKLTRLNMQISEYKANLALMGQSNRYAFLRLGSQ